MDEILVWYFLGIILMMESFYVIRPNLLKVCARTDPELSSLVIFCVFQPICQVHAIPVEISRYAQTVEKVPSPPTSKVTSLQPA